MSVSVHLAGGLLAAVAWVCPVAAYAISGNTQVSLAGAGKFDQLAQGVEEMIGKEPMKAADWHALCFAYSRIKRYSKIIDCLDELDKAMAKPDKRTRLFGLDDGTATAYLMRAEVMVEMGEYAGALTQAEKTIEWYKREKSGDKDILINALAAKALALLALKQRPAAEKVSSELEALPLGILGSDFIPVKSLAMARVSMALGRWQQALDALGQDKTIGLRSFMDNLASGAFLRGVNNWVWIELPRGFMQTKALMELGRVDEAKAGYDKLLAVPQVVANGEIYWLALFDRGRIAELQKQPAEAEQFYLRAASVVERQRRSINSEANKIGFVGDKQAVYMRLVAVQFEQGKYAQAFESMERGKSRALVDMLASRPSDGLTAKSKSSAGPSTQEVLTMERMRQADLEAHRQDEASIAAALKPGDGLRAKSIAGDLPGALSSLVSVSGLDVRAAQGLIGEDEALLVYFGDGSRMYATLVQRSGAYGVSIDAGTLEADIRLLRKNLQEGLPAAQRQLQSLHKLLIAPLTQYIRAKRLTIVPHGALHYLPFAAMNDGSKDLVDQYILRTLPSVAVLQHLRPSRVTGVNRMLILGNPDLNNPKCDLPGAHIEAEKLASQFKPEHVLLRKQASRTAFQQLAPQASFIHVASHGEFDSGKPLQSSLILATDTPGAALDTGRLTVSDIYQLKLDAELVTLSACETGLGQVANGDDVVGLTRGFLYAGTSTVIASLWQVDDEATAFLMLRMYEHMRQGGTSDALRQAQMETRAKFPHPFYWASFYLTGVNR
jgi:CHAT domain-containing protein/tetratricopeptide (TPR) repeat protein